MREVKHFVLRTFNLFSNGTIHARHAWTKEKYDKVAPVIDPALVASKNSDLLKPEQAPDFYIKAVDQRSKAIKIPYDGWVSTYHPKHFVKDKASGLRAAIYRDGHGNTILAFNGIAKPWRDSATPFDEPSHYPAGLNEVNAATEGLYGPQMRAALRLYKKVVNDPATTRLQVLGYSLGSMFTNEVAARFGQNGLTFANLGMHSKLLKDPARVKNIEAGVTDLQVKGDMFTGLAGENHAKKKDVTQADLSTGHRPADYALHADPKLAKAARYKKLAVEERIFARASAPGSL